MSCTCCVCQCLSCWPSWLSNSNKCHFTPKWLLTLFQCCRVLYLSPSQMDISVMCLSPTMNKSTSVMKCLLLGSMWMLDWKYITLIWAYIYHIHTYVYVCCDLTVFHLLFAVEPPSDLKFKIINENTVEMTWARPPSRIDGFRIQVVSDAGQYEVSAYSVLIYTFIASSQLIYC